MNLSDVLFAFKNLVLAGFREPSLLWQIAPILLLWIILVFYFGTHKHEQLGWNTSLANGISLFWVIVSGMQRIFSEGGAHFTWTKFIIFLVITVYALIVVYISFEHRLPAKWTYGLASHHLIYYLSFLSILYAYDMIYLNIPMFIAIIILFGFILLFSFLLKKLLPALEEDIDDQIKEPAIASFEPIATKKTSSSNPGGIEKQMGKKPLSENGVKF